MKRRENLILLCVTALCFLLISFLSFQRSYFGFGTETDYLGGFLPEAQRIIQREPLLLEFHPPLYSIFLALVQTMTQEWLRTGLLISLAASAVALVTNFWFFYRLLGIYAGWGALLGLIASDQFIQYSAYATSDIFSFALYSICLLLSILAVQKKLGWLWILCGLAVGSLLLTRTNGITCLFIAVLPFWSNSSFKQKFNDFLYFGCGLLIPLLSWAFYASFSGSQLTPAGTYANFALTYFSDSSDRISGDARVQVEEKFDSLISVLSYDPIHIAKTYLRDLFSLGYKMAGMLQHPLNLFVLIGIFSSLKKRPREQKLCVFYIILTLLQVLLINFKAYEARYFLFFLPILGVFVGEAFRYLIFLTSRQPIRRAAIGFCMTCALFSIVLSYSTAWEAVSLSTGELADAVPKVQALGLSRVSVVARKPHIAFYTDSTQLGFPDVETIPELRCSLETRSDSGDLLLYFGTQERSYRRQLKALSDPETSPYWLEPIEQSTTPSLWVLYRYKPVTPLRIANSCRS